MSSTNDYIDSNIGGDGLTITPQIKNFLYTTAKWAKFLSIIGFIGVFFMVLAALFMGTIMGMAGSEFDELYGGASAIGPFISILYLILAVLYCLPIYFLYQFSSKMTNALDHNDQHYLEGAFENLKKHYKFIGILMAIIMGFYALMLVVTLLGGAAAMF